LQPPPPPADGAGYVLVRSKEKSYWRRKRGTIKKAVVNSSLKRNATATLMASPAAKRILSKLEPFVRSLQTGRFIANVSSRLIKSMKANSGEMDFSFLEKYDLQPWYPMENVFKGSYSITEKNNEISIRIPVDKNTVKRLNKEITGYYFEAVVLWGHIQKPRGLRVDSDISPVYGFEDTKTECKLSLSLPTQNIPWMLMLKLSCHEGNAPAFHPRHYGMKVVKVGNNSC
jgi:hypothetical protein